MGTSSIYNGPIKGNRLLPSDYSDEDGDINGGTMPNDPADGQMDVPSVAWSTVKSDFSKYIKSKSGNSEREGGSIRHIAQQYVRASGGTRAVMSQAVSGTSSGRALHGFFDGINAGGIRQTLKTLNIVFQGKSVNEVMSLLVNVISPKSTTKEGIVAREATQDALAYLYDFIERNEMDISCLDSMPQELVETSLCAYIESYIWGMMLKDLASRLEKYENNPAKAYEIEQDLKGYIKGIVEVEFEKDKEIFSNRADDAVSVLMKKCYVVVEGIV